MIGERLRVETSPRPLLRKEGRIGSGENETADIPKLIHEIAVTCDFFLIKPDVITRRGTHHEREPHGIGAEFGNHIERVYAIARGFGHFSAITIAHKPVEIHRTERNVAYRIERHNNHAGYPKEKDIIARFHYARRMIGNKIVCFLGFTRRSGNGGGP